MGKLAAVLMAALVMPAGAAARPADKPTATNESGTLSVCNRAGANPLDALTFTLVAPAWANGSVTLTVGVGTCSVKVFYPVGAPVTVTETVPAGYAVTAIGLSPGGGPSKATLVSMSPVGGSAQVSIGSGDATLTFVTSAQQSPCTVPQLVGLALGSAKSALERNGCTTGRVTRAYSREVHSGRVMSQTPPAGVTLAPGTPVALVLSRGPHR
jgi:hypothetical protein